MHQRLPELKPQAVCHVDLDEEIPWLRIAREEDRMNSDVPRILLIRGILDIDLDQSPCERLQRRPWAAWEVHRVIHRVAEFV